MSVFGGPEVLELKTIPDPEPQAGEVLVRLHAAGVNPAETYARTGTYAFYKPPLPTVLGFDGAGVVEKTGGGVSTLRVGQRVLVAAMMAKRQTGTYAEKMVCDASCVHPIPDSVSYAQGAAVGVPGHAAYRALFQRARLKPGETVLIHGASGGVGTLAVQLARACGARVIGTAGSDDGLKLLEKIGAHAVLNHKKPGYMDELPLLTGGKGPEVIIEMLADMNLEKDMSAVAKFGRVVIIGSRGALNFTPRLMMGKESNLHGMAVWNATQQEANQAGAAIAAALESGALRPVEGDILPLEKAAQAHLKIIQRGGKPGKLTLRID